MKQAGDTAPSSAAMAASGRAIRPAPPRSTARTALKILELFSPAEPVLGVSEIGRRLGVHKSNVSRLVAALQAEDFLTRTEDGRYRLGLHLYAMGSTIVHSHALYQAALAELCEVRMATGESAHLAVLDGIEVVHLARLPSNRFMRRIAESWNPSPPHATSTGKVLLAHASDETIGRLVARGLRRFTPRTVTDVDRLKRELGEIRARGFALDREEFVRGTSSVAVPIFTRSRRTVAAISVVAPSERLREPQMGNVLRLLTDVALRISGGVS